MTGFTNGLLVSLFVGIFVTGENWWPAQVLTRCQPELFPGIKYPSNDQTSHTLISNHALSTRTRQQSLGERGIGIDALNETNYHDFIFLCSDCFRIVIKLKSK